MDADGVICPTGCLRNPGPALFEKIFRFPRRANQIYDSRHPVPIRGAYASSRTLGAGCDDAVATQDERRWRGRRSRVVLTPPTLASSGGVIRKRRLQQARSPGERGGNRLKPLRREGRVKPVNLW